MANETLFPAFKLWVQECFLQYTYKVCEHITVMSTGLELQERENVLNKWPEGVNDYGWTLK